MKRVTIVTLAILAIIAVAAAAYESNPTHYLNIDVQEAIPDIVADYTITQHAMITIEDLPLLAIWFSENNMLSWQAALAEGPITTWSQIRVLKYHTFDKSTDSAGVVTYTPRDDRTLVGSIDSMLLRIFFDLKQ